MLQVLYLQQNKLKSLPSSLGNLTKLTTLNLSENALKVNIILILDMIVMYKSELKCFETETKMSKMCNSGASGGNLQSDQPEDLGLEKQPKAEEDSKGDSGPEVP